MVSGVLWCIFGAYFDEYFGGYIDIFFVHFDMMFILVDI
jgi:hypothetical protein